jgi:seryl-tRNA synthetase
MDKILRTFIEENGYTYNEHQDLIEDLTLKKIKLKRMKERYEEMTIEKYEEDKKNLGERIKKLENQLNEKRKEFQDNLTNPQDLPLKPTKKKAAKTKK